MDERMDDLRATMDALVVPGPEDRLGTVTADPVERPVMTTCRLFSRIGGGPYKDPR